MFPSVALYDVLMENFFQKYEFCIYASQSIFYILFRNTDVL